jgi:hypothetical protein
MVETWFKVMLAAFIPIGVAFFIPSYYLYCFAASGLLILVGIVLMLRSPRPKP